MVDQEISARIDQVRQIANSHHFRLPNLDCDELFSVGLSALNEAISKHDESKGSLSLRVEYLVKHRIIDHMRRSGHKTRSQYRKKKIANNEAWAAQMVVWRRDELDWSLDFIGAEPDVPPLPSHENASVSKATVHSLLGTLTDRNRCVVEDVYIHGRRQKEVAKKYRLHESRISQIVTESLIKMRQAYFAQTTNSLVKKCPIQPKKSVI